MKRVSIEFLINPSPTFEENGLIERTGRAESERRSTAEPWREMRRRKNEAGRLYAVQLPLPTQASVYKDRKTGNSPRSPVKMSRATRMTSWSLPATTETSPCLNIEEQECHSPPSCCSPSSIIDNTLTKGPWIIASKIHDSLQLPHPSLAFSSATTDQDPLNPDSPPTSSPSTNCFRNTKTPTDDTVALVPDQLAALVAAAASSYPDPPPSRQELPRCSQGHQPHEIQQCLIAHLTETASTGTSPVALRQRPRPFTCPHEDCSKTFPSRSRLQRHIFVHTGLRPYACMFPGCSRMFGRKDNMLQHYRAHVITTCPQLLSKRRAEKFDGADREHLLARDDT